MAERAVADEFEWSVATTPPTSRQRRLAFAMVGVLFIVFVTVAPFASMQLARIDSFLPVVQGMIAVADFVTAVLLFNLFSIMGSRALLVLAIGYFFSALIAIPHSLSFPGAFAPTGVLGGLQTTPWLFVFRHFGFAAAVLGYAWVKNETHSRDVTQPSTTFAVWWSVTIVIGLVLLLTWSTTTGEKFMPRLLSDQISFTSLGKYVSVVILVTSAIAVVLLWFRHSSVLDLWLIVTLCALISHMANNVFLIPGRFSAGWYSSRFFSVIVSTAVLSVLLSETSRLYGNLSRLVVALRHERDSTLSANRRLAGQWARLRKANAFKSEIMGTLAHDLRNPLTAMIGRTEMMLRTIDKGPVSTDRLRAQIDQVHVAANRLNEMVGSLLSDARADALDINNRLHETDLSTVVREVAEANHSLAAKKEQSIIVMAPAECPVLCDSDRMREVIDNLLSNGIKFSQFGGRIYVELERQNNGAIIRVKDEGAGLSPEDLSRVFGRFQRLSARPTGDEISTGLGLSIVKRIVDLHGGSIAAESPGIGLGATLIVTVPLGHSR